MTLYKLTDEKFQTHNQTQWGEGIEHTTSGTGEMCSRGWLHAYADPYLAVVFNPVHANFANPVLWEAEGEIGKTDGLKVGTTRLKTVRQIELPLVSTNARVRFAIYAVLEVYTESSFVEWTQTWLMGKDRGSVAAIAAKESADKSNQASTRTVASGSYAAARAAHAAASAVEPEPGWVTAPVWSALNAADAAAWSGTAAVKAAGKTLNFSDLLQKAIKDETTYEAMNK
jgi:hypothetical protein